MKYQRFEDLPVWKAAVQSAAQVCALTEKSEFQKRYSLRDQIDGRRPSGVLGLV